MKTKFHPLRTYSWQLSVTAVFIRIRLQQASSNLAVTYNHTAFANCLHPRRIALLTDRYSPGRPRTNDVQVGYIDIRASRRTAKHTMQALSGSSLRATDSTHSNSFLASSLAAFSRKCGERDLRGEAEEGNPTVSKWPVFVFRCNNTHGSDTYIYTVGLYVLQIRYYGTRVTPQFLCTTIEIRHIYPFQHRRFLCRPECFTL